MSKVFVLEGGVVKTEEMEAVAGKTPEKGVDYWTEEDKAEIVSDVLAAMPEWTGGSY